VWLDVVRPDQYDALLASGGLNEAGELDLPASAVVATGTIGGRTTVAEDVARQRKQIFVGIVMGAAACLGFAALVLWRRGRRAAEAEKARLDGNGEGFEEPESEGVEDLGSNGADSSDPGERRPARAAGKQVARANGKGKICPTCGGRYDDESMFCGKDGTQLVPLN
jgi:hypothetical protein